MVVRLLLLRRMHFLLRTRQKINTVKCSCKAILQCFGVYGGAVYFFLAGDDLQQRERIFRSSVMGQEA